MSRRIDVAQTAELLSRQEDILLLTHRRPDGDTIGSAAALCLGLRSLGKRAWLAENAELTKKLAPYAAGLFAPADVTPGFILAADIADEALLCPSMACWKGKVDLCIDHHPSNREYAHALLLDGGAAATGELICQVLKALGAPFDLEIYARLYLAVATDTGCFKFSNTTPYAHTLAAECIAAGLEFHPINRQFFQMKSRVRMELERSLFADMVFSPDGRVAAAYLTRAFIDGLGADNDDLDNLSTLTMEVEGVVCGIVLTENEPAGSYKASVRTQKPADASAICGVFGGGGHARAAGATLSGCDGGQLAQKLMDAALAELEHHV